MKRLVLFAVLAAMFLSLPGCGLFHKETEEEAALRQQQEMREKMFKKYMDEKKSSEHKRVTDYMN